MKSCKFLVQIFIFPKINCSKAIYSGFKNTKINGVVYVTQVAGDVKKKLTKTIVNVEERIDQS